MKTLNELFEDMLKDVYYAEKKILKELPKMAKKASCDELRDAFENHLEETEGQVERLEQVFEIIGKSPKAKKCEAIEGIAAEAKAVMDECERGDVCDAGLIAAAQAVEHYEMARYGALVAWAKELGIPKAAKLLQQTLDQEGDADETLSELAEGGINEAANSNEEEDEDAAPRSRRAA